MDPQITQIHADSFGETSPVKSANLRNLRIRRVFSRSNLTGTSSIAWVVASALVLRSIALFQYDPVTFDSALYFEMAALFRGGHWSEALAYDYPPLYALLIAGLQPLVGTGGAALLIASTADLLILVPVIAIARRAVGEEAAWAAAFLWVVHPSAIRFGVQALSDAPTALCVATALYAGLRALEQRRFRLALGAGMASGLAFLFRPEGLEPAVALAVFYACSAPSTQRLASSGQPRGETGGSALGAQRSALSGRAIRRVAWILAPLAGWALVAGPYVAYISLEAGTLTLSKKKSVASVVRLVAPAPGVESRMPRVESREPRAEDRKEGQNAPASAQEPLRRFGRTIYIFQKPLVNGLNPLLIVLACVGLAGVIRGRASVWNRTHALLVGLFIFHLGILIGLAADKGVAYLGRHHFLLMVVYALPVASAGLVWAVAWLGDRVRRRRWVPATVFGLIVVATGFALVTRGPDQGRSLRLAGAWIRSQVVGTPVIVTSLAKLTYHAHAERVDIRGTYDEILRRGRERSADFVALYPDLIQQTSPDFLMQLRSSDLELVKVFPEPTPQAPDQRLELYRLRPKGSKAPNGS
jgi:hypothetical protein